MTYPTPWNVILSFYAFDAEETLMFVISCLAEESTDPAKAILPWLTTTITATSTTTASKQHQQHQQHFFAFASAVFRFV